MWVIIYKPREPSSGDTIFPPLFIHVQQLIYIVICLTAPIPPHGVSRPTLAELHIPYSVHYGPHGHILHAVHFPITVSLSLSVDGLASTHNDTLCCPLHCAIPVIIMHDLPLTLPGSQTWLKSC